MRMLRAVPDVRLALALLLVCSLAAPRAPLYLHHHAGGEHAHVHAEAVAGGLPSHDDHGHRPHPTTGTGGRPAVTRGADAPDGHVHHQQRYDAAVVPAAAVLTVSAPLAPPRPAPIRRAPTRRAAATTARAPPLAPLV